MSNTELIKKVEDIKTLQNMIDELTAEMESKKDEVKKFMDEQEVEEISVSCFKVRYKTVTSSRFDSTAFKKTHEELYSQYTKQTTTRRFSIA